MKRISYIWHGLCIVTFFAWPFLPFPVLYRHFAMTQLCIVGVYWSGLVLIGLLSGLTGQWVRDFTARYPDDAYMFFCDNPTHFKVFLTTDRSLIIRQLPAVRGLPWNAPVGPFKFEVPNLNNRRISVYGVSKDCMSVLNRYVTRMKAEEDPISLN